VNQTDIDDRSASVQNITHVTRDKRIENDIDVQNVTHVDVTKIHASDISSV
jgi:tRNA(adenine34) deaminase